MEHSEQLEVLGDDRLINCDKDEHTDDDDQVWNHEWTIEVGAHRIFESDNLQLKVDLIQIDEKGDHP